jgi:hypothetical protein
MQERERARRGHYEGGSDRSAHSDEVSIGLDQLVSNDAVQLSTLHLDRQE